MIIAARAITLKSLPIWLSFLLGGTAVAWNSGPEKNPGPKEARNTWSFSEPTNEHANLLLDAASAGGIPASLLLGSFQLSVFTDAKRTVPTNEDGSQTDKSIAPVFFGLADGKVTRGYTVPGFAGLPDHSYSLWDWVLGNEVCPTGTVTAAPGNPVSCHTLSSHLGPVNSTHFPPQAENIYRWYHSLAIDRATNCKDLTDRKMASNLQTTAKDRLDQMIMECEREALSIEAVGQHFLQDTWAIGHMWERWGFPDIKRFPAEAPAPEADAERRLRASIVALTAGLIHGAEAKTGTPDQMSRGDDPDVAWSTPGIRNSPGIGDIHLNELKAGGAYLTQQTRLIQCSARGLREVYAKTAQAHGALPPNGAIDSVNLLSNECFAQRAINRALKRGFGLDTGLGFLPLGGLVDNAVFGFSLHVVNPLPTLATISRLRERYVLEIANLALRVNEQALLDRDGTSLAESGLDAVSSSRRLMPPPIMGVFRNGFVTQDPPQRYADPKLPWPSSIGTPPHIDNPENHARSIARAFHLAHVADWCTDPEASLASLTQRVTDLQAALADDTIACEICTEFASRHVSIGGTASICAAATASADLQSFIARPGITDIRDAAQDKCGCSNSATLAVPDLAPGWVGLPATIKPMFCLKSSV